MANLLVIFNVHTNVAGKEYHPGDVGSLTPTQLKAFMPEKRRGRPHVQRCDINGKALKKLNS